MCTKVKCVLVVTGTGTNIHCGAKGDHVIWKLLPAYNIYNLDYILDLYTNNKHIRFINCKPRDR